MKSEAMSTKSMSHGEVENHFFSLTGVWLWALGSGGQGERFDLSLSVLAGLGGEQWAEEVGGLVRWVRGLFSGAAGRLSAGLDRVRHIGAGEKRRAKYGRARGRGSRALTKWKRRKAAGNLQRAWKGRDGPWGPWDFARGAVRA